MSDSISGSPINNERKAEALDFILQNAFRSGFGSLNKTELDAILFATLMKYGNSNDLTDLEMSKYLQITQRRIQNLKERVSVKYLQISRSEAISEFIDKLDYAKKDEIYIDIPIRNVAVKNEIEGILDENNILLHSQLNSKIFRVRIDDLLELIIIFEANEKKSSTGDDFKKKIIDRIRTTNGMLSEINQEIAYDNESQIYTNLKNKVLKSGIDVGLEIIKATIPAGGIAAAIIEKLITNFGNLRNV